MKVSKTAFYSWKAGPLADGCRQCVQGRKLVLFVTGLCSARCDFCPISDKKLYKDVIYANERPIGKDAQIIEEATVSGARGAGITGGDPLMQVKRTARYIRLLKKAFGKSFHIHLYTPLRLVNSSNLKMLHDAGLDEIRFHPDPDTQGHWPRLLLARQFSWHVGAEIPAIPGKEEQTKRLIDFLQGKVEFLNINELELADNAVWRKRHVKCKDGLSYAIKGSEELALELLRYAAGKGMRAHYCTCTLKDRIQLSRRVKLRARNIRHPFDTITREGMLVRGALYPESLVPGPGYRKRLEGLAEREKTEMLKSLRALHKGLARSADVAIDTYKPRLLMSRQAIQRLRQIPGFARAIVKEYPTFDSLELEVEVLR